MSKYPRYSVIFENEVVYKIAHVNNIWICIWTFSSTVNPSGWTEANFLWGARLNRKKIFHPESDKF